MEGIIFLCKESKTDSELWENALAKIVTEDFQTDSTTTDLILTHVVPMLKVFFLFFLHVFLTFLFG
jgi:hypothetical protein